MSSPDRRADEAAPQNDSTNAAIDPALLRATHDPARPARDTGAAKAVLGFSRTAVIAGIKRGTIPGYAIQGKSRARWFVYSDFLDPGAQTQWTRDVDLTRTRQRLTALENELALERARAEIRRESQQKFSEAVELMADANRRLVDAYRKLDQAEQVDAAERVGRWVPDGMDGEA